MDWRIIVGRNIRRLREERGLTQEKLAIDSEIDLTYLGGIERGRRNPSLLVITRIASALDTPPSHLLSCTMNDALDPRLGSQPHVQR